MGSPWIDTRAKRFLDFLRERYQSDRGALAQLRSGISLTKRPNLWPLLAPFPDAIGNEIFEIVAALWARDPGFSENGENLGHTLRKLGALYSTFSGRFRRLLSCDANEIPSRIASVVSAAQEKGVSVDYTRLLSDLLNWNDRTRIEWAKAFWGSQETQKEEPAASLASSQGDVAP